MAMTHQTNPKNGVGMNDFVEKIRQFVKFTNIYVLVYSAVVIPLLIILTWAYVADKIFNGKIPEQYTSIVIACSMLISSVGGIIQIIRKESPGLLGIPFRGIFPVATGILWVAVCWSLACLLFFSALIE
jgi:hypothetical protein